MSSIQQKGFYRTFWFKLVFCEEIRGLHRIVFLPPPAVIGAKVATGVEPQPYVYLYEAFKVNQKFH